MLQQNNLQYKSEDFQGAIEDKREARRIRLLEAENCSNSSIFLDYKKIIQDSIGCWEAEDEDDLIEEITTATGWCINNINYEVQLLT